MVSYHFYNAHFSFAAFYTLKHMEGVIFSLILFTIATKSWASCFPLQYRVVFVLWEHMNFKQIGLSEFCLMLHVVVVVVECAMHVGNIAPLTILRFSMQGGVGNESLVLITCACFTLSVALCQSCCRVILQ